MPKPDDFDLIPRESMTPPPEEPEEYDEPEAGGRNWRWLVTLAGVAFLFFAIGAALFTLRERLGGESDPAPRPPTATPAGTAVGWLATLVAMGSPTTTVTTPTPTPVASRTPTPTASVTPTPTPCAIALAPAFEALYRREVFGCALTPPGQVVWAAWEPFERGSMLWRSDTNRSYFFTLGGAWQVIDAAWDGQPPPGRGDAPPGLRAPERGFGWVWGTRDDIFQALGWARDGEKGFCAEVQEFEQGFFLQSNATPSCTADNLYNQASAGDWQTTVVAAHKSGVWSGSLGGNSVVAAAPTRVIDVAARPEGNGVFRATNGLAINVDGQAGEWPAAGWIPINTPVEGSGNYDGPADLYAVFQTAWTPQGLILAAQVADDRFRPGPQGTDLWQGDALEVQLDAQLVADFADTTASADDFQLGIAASPGGGLQVYRWLPLAQEGPVSILGSGVGLDRGYTIEVLIPWSTFGVGSVQAGDTFGFNLSVSDNDGDAPAQETVLSASPARTTYDNPAEWGTLVLMP